MERSFVARALVVAAVVVAALEVGRRAAELGWETMPTPVPVLALLLLAAAVMVYTPVSFVAWAPAVVMVVGAILTGLSSGFMLLPAVILLVGTLFVARAPPSARVRGPGFEPGNR